jgi:hypothetical protein
MGAVEADHGAARQKAQENPQAAIVARNAGKLFLDGTVVAFRELTLSVRQQEIPRIVTDEEVFENRLAVSTLKRRSANFAGDFAEFLDRRRIDPDDLVLGVTVWACAYQISCGVSTAAMDDVEANRVELSREQHGSICSLEEPHRSSTQRVGWRLAIPVCSCAAPTCRVIAKADDVVETDRRMWRSPGLLQAMHECGVFPPWNVPGADFTGS